MVTPVEKRAQPERRADQYSLYHLQDLGLAPARDDALSIVQGFLGYNSALGYGDLAGPFAIGFDMNFDRTGYKQMLVSKAGWLLLVDPAVDASTVSMVDVGPTSGYDTNTFLSGSFPSGSHVVLAPWATKVRPISNSHPYITSSLGQRVQQGFEPAPAALLFDEIEYGIRYGCINTLDGRASVVRWNGYSTCNSNRQVFRLKFDVLLHENGRIDFCYGRKSQQERIFYEDTLGMTDERAAVLAITSGAGVRDFSLSLGYAPYRTQHRYGGFKPDGSFVENGASYANGLRYDLHWPGGPNGGRLSFRPPTNRRKVIRSAINIESSRISLPSSALGIGGGASPSWLDTEALAYTTSSVNFPTTLSRFAGGKTHSTADRQDLIVHDLEATLQRSKRAGDPWISPSSPRSADAFTERTTRSSGSYDSFFSSCSNPDMYEGLLEPSLANKLRVDISLPVNYTTRLFESTGSLYYYNPSQRRWLLPPAATSASTGSITSSLLIKNSDYTFPSNALWPASGTTSFVGFTPAGAFAASASFAPATPGQSPRRWWQPGQPNIDGNSFTTGLLGEVLSLPFDKSITVDPKLNAGVESSFTLPIDRNFLLEKMIVRLPIAAGSGWLRDVTRSSINGWTNFGGPALTVALFHEQLGDGTAFRNLILSGTVTNSSDSVGSVSASLSAESSAMFSTVGLPAHGATPCAVVPPATSFTGTVELACEAAVSNGVTVLIELSLGTTSGTLPYLSSSTTAISLGETYVRSPEYVSPIGRAKNGLSFDERSPYGKLAAGVNFKVENPFVLPIIDPSNIMSLGGSPSDVTLASFAQVKTHVRSPYIIKPGDRLVLAVSKAAPANKSTMHDVSLSSGTIDASFYGCHLQSGVERPAGSQQQLITNALHQTVGDDPILDQVVGGYADLRYGTTGDDFMLGSTLRLAAGTFITGSRSRLFSRARARATTLYSGSALTGSSFLPPNVLVYPLSSSYDISLLGSRLSEIIQPPYTKAGMPYSLKIFDANERYYDTLVPSIADCLKVNGSQIVRYTPTGNRIVFFDETRSTFLPYADGVWLRSFPFEPRYSGAAKLASLDRSFVASSYFGGTSIGMLPTDPFASTAIAVSVYSGDFGAIHLGDFLYSDPGGSFPSGLLSSDVDQKTFTKFVYGFGKSVRPIVSGSGLGQRANFRTMNSWFSTRPNGNETYVVSPQPEGWKYGLRSGFAEYSSCHWRPDRFGQFRDLLEQRSLSRFAGGSDGAVTVRFIDGQGRLTKPESTWSSNLSVNCTSSLPYFDGIARNREDIVIGSLNQSVVALKSTQFGNPTI